MSDNGIDRSRFQLPEQVVEELTAEGYIAAPDQGLTKDVGVGLIVLTVYNTAASTVQLMQTPGVIRALAESLRKWFRRMKGESDKFQFELTARGPHGFVDFKSDHEPDSEGLVQFLRENVWGDAAPPDGDAAALPAVGDAALPDAGDAD